MILRAWLLLILISAGSICFGSDLLFKLDSNSQQCVPTEAGLKPHRAYKVQDNFYVKELFLEKNPFCKNLPTCLDADRMQNLIFNNDIPHGANSSGYLNSEFKEKAERACEHPDGLNTIRSLSDFADFLARKQKAYPIESKLAYDLVKDTKAYVEDYFENSALALETLKTCLKSEEAQAKSQPHCAALRAPDSEFQQLPGQLKRMRQALLAMALMNKFGSDEKTFEVLVADIHKGNQLTPPPLEHLKDSFGGLFRSRFWNGTPNNLEAATKEERETLLAYVDQIKKKYSKSLNLPDDEKKKIKMLRTKDFILGKNLDSQPLTLQEAFEADYYESLSNSPVIANISTAKPNSQELVKAVELQQKRWKKASETILSDIDYLNMPSALQAVIEKAPKEKRGDLCTLAAYMSAAQEDFYKQPEEFLNMLMFAEGGFAINAAKGLGKKAAAAFAGARFSGPAVMSSTLAKKTMEYNKQIKVCSQSSQSSNGLCNVEKMKTDYSQSLMTLGAMILFGSPKTFMVLAPLTIEGDAGK